MTIAPAPWEGWHVLKAPDRINRPPFTRVEIGVPIHATGCLYTHSNGMHATPDILYAINHTGGLWYCRVQLLGERIDEDDQSCARTRVVLWMLDASAVLIRWCWRVLKRVLTREVQAGRPPARVLWRALRFLHVFPGPGAWPQAHDARVDLENEIRRRRPHEHNAAPGGPGDKKAASWAWLCADWAIQTIAMAGHPQQEERREWDDGTGWHGHTTVKPGRWIRRGPGFDWSKGPLGLGSGGGIGAVARIAVSHAQTLAKCRNEDSAQAAAQEERWQRMSLETMVFRAAGQPVVHWRPQLAPVTQAAD